MIAGGERYSSPPAILKHTLVPETVVGFYINPVPPKQTVAFLRGTEVDLDITSQRCCRLCRGQSTWRPEKAHD